MNFRIENGVTIITTGDAKGGLKNKNGHAGIYFDNRSQQYRAEVTYKKKKYHLGYSKDVEALILIRKEAEIHIKNGSFVEWFDLRRKTKKKGDQI